MRDCSLLSDLSVLAPTRHLAACKARAVSRSAPRRGPPAYQARDRRTVRRDGLPADALRWSAPGAGRPSPWLGPAPEASPAVSMATAARSSTRFWGTPRCTTLTRTADASRQL